MKPCDRIRSALIDLRYGLLQADQERACRQHLAGCPACAAELAALERLVGALGAKEAFPRESEVDWDRFARATVQRVLAESEPARPAGWRERLRSLAGSWAEALRLPAPASPAWAAAASVALVVGLGALAYTFLPIGRGPEPPPPAVAARILMSQPSLDNLTVNLARQNTAQYLRETRAVLVTLLDVTLDCERDRIDVSAERAKATELLRRQRLIAAELHRMPLARARDVCNDLEKLLLEVASLADCARTDEIQTLRDVVEKRQILVRMELLSQELAKREGLHA